MDVSLNGSPYPQKSVHLFRCFFVTRQSLRTLCLHLPLRFGCKIRYPHTPPLLFSSTSPSSDTKSIFLSPFSLLIVFKPEEWLFLCVQFVVFKWYGCLSVFFWEVNNTYMIDNTVCVLYPSRQLLIRYGIIIWFLLSIEVSEQVFQNGIIIKNNW